MRKTLYSFLGCVAGVPLADLLLPGVHAPDLRLALIAGAAVGLVYLLLRPIAKVITFPLALLTLGLLYLLLDAGLLWLVAQRFDGLHFDSFAWAIAAAMFINLLRRLLRGAARNQR